MSTSSPPSRRSGLPLRARLATTVGGAAGRASRLAGRGDGSVIGGVIGLRSTIIAHTGDIGERGKIVIEKNAVIMSCCTVVCSAGQTLTIGEGSVLSAGSVASNNIPRHTLCAGPRIKPVAKVTTPYTLETSYKDFLRGLRPLGAANKSEE